MSSNINITRRDQEQLIVRADSHDPKTKAAFASAGLELPEARRRTEAVKGALMWFSPDEILAFVENAEAAQAAIAAELPERHLIHDATGARVVFRLEGRYLRDVFAKGAPRDLRKVEIGEVVRTRLGQVAVAFWFLDEKTAEIVCFRSVASFVAEWLEMAAQEDGLPVLS